MLRKSLEDVRSDQLKKTDKWTKALALLTKQYECYMKASFADERIIIAEINSLEKPRIEGEE